MMKIITGKNHPVLRSKVKKIEKITPEIIELARQMFQTMKESDGIGLAAPQVGKNIQLFIVDEAAFQSKQNPNAGENHTRGLSKWEFRKIGGRDVSKGYAFINPVITNYPKGREQMREGCLSLPGWDGIVARSKRITIKAQDVEGKTFKLHAKGLLAKVLQHEYDHLQGVLICDKWKNKRRVQGKGFRVKGIVFFGSSPYSRIVLDSLKGTAYEPELVLEKNKPYTLSPKPYTLGIVAAYGAIIPQEVIKKFKRGIINIHPSLLPKYRGPSPVQSAILNGDSLTGVTVIKLTEKVDTGPIIAQRAFPVKRSYTSPELHHVLFFLGAELLLEVLPRWINGAITPLPQDEGAASYTKQIRKKDGLINWEEDAQLIERKIRAYQPWPSAYTFFEHRGKVLRVQLLEGQISDPLTSHNEPGNIVPRNQVPFVECGKGILTIKKLRPEGKREMSGEEFLRGYEATKFFSKTS